MEENSKLTEKKRGHRKRKFGNEESKVISFRIAKDTYEKNKEEIREKINNVIESEVNKKRIKKKEIKGGIESYYSNIKNAKENIKREEDNQEKVFFTRS